MNALLLDRQRQTRPERAKTVANLMPPTAAPMRSRRSLRRWLRALGWPGILGLGLLVMAATFYLSTLQPAAMRLQEARQSIASLQEQIAQKGRSPTGADRPAAEQLADFYRLFPAEKELPNVLGKIFAAAHAQGLVLEQGEYKTGEDKIGRLMHYEITLPLKAEYPQIRRFLAGLAKDVPVVALEQVEFERQKVGVAAVDTKIKLILYLERQT